MSENDLKRAAAKGEASYEGNLPVRQRIARCLWFDQSFEPMPKRTDDGQKLVVFFPRLVEPRSRPGLPKRGREDRGEAPGQG